MVLTSLDVFQSDQEKLEAIRNNSNQKDAALKSIYKECRPKIKQLAKNFNLLQEDWEDTLQDAIITFYKNLTTKGLILNVKISTYIYEICKRTFLKLVRRTKNINIIDITEIDTDIDVGNNSNEELDAKNLEQLAKALNDLGERCKEIITKFYLGTSMEELALQYDYSNTATVTNIKYKCMQQLKKKFANN